MNIRSIILASAFFSVAQLVIPHRAVSVDVSLPDGIANASTDILSKLGYDCQTASAGGIICKKCTDKSFTQDCVVYLCDAVTRKCRKKSAEVPKVPNLNRESDSEGENNDIKLPKL